MANTSYKKAATRQANRPDNTIQREAAGSQAFGRRNFIAMIAAGVLIVLGFVLMAGPSSTPETFEPDIFSTRRIVVGPTLAFLGFVAMAIAIIIKPGTAKVDQTDNEDKTTWIG